MRAVPLVQGTTTDEVRAGAVLCSAGTSVREAGGLWNQTLRHASPAPRQRPGPRGIGVIRVQLPFIIR